jgi:hypothetical protein
MLKNTVEYAVKLSASIALMLITILRRLAIDKVIYT